MLDETDAVILASGNLEHVRGLARLLGRRGIQSAVVAPPEGRGSS
jgi:Cft2 family RNA processing exonuclease